MCTHNEDERGECRRLRVIPPLNSDCDVVGAKDDCVEFHCVIAEVWYFVAVDNYVLGRRDLVGRELTEPVKRRDKTVLLLMPGFCWSRIGTHSSSQCYTLLL